jgi:hypothetical protein
MKRVEVTMPALFEWQREVHENPSRFRVVSAGRRSGKTMLALACSLEVALQGGRSWWVAPTYGVGDIAWRQLRSLLKSTKLGKFAVLAESKRAVFFLTGGEIWFKSADNEDGLRGEGLDFLVMDEAAYIGERVWESALRPALADRQGRALFISTPAGRNWFWRAFVAGQNAEPGMRSWKFATSCNPIMPADEIDKARASMTARLFSQEFLAEFIEDTSGVFRNVASCATSAAITAPVVEEDGTQHVYVMGCDLARKADFTVLTVLDASTKHPRMVALDRFNQIDWKFQMGRIEALARRLQVAHLVVDQTGVGDPILEDLRRGFAARNPSVILSGFQFTNATKQQGIERLALAFELGEIEILPDPVLTFELEAIEWQRTPSGLTRYSAPEGLHDDCVMSLMMAHQAVVGDLAFPNNTGIIEFYRQEIYARRAKAAGVDLKKGVAK